MKRDRTDAARKTDDARAAYRGSRVLVLGLARSGIAAARLLGREGAHVVAADENPSIALPDDLASLDVRRGVFGGDILDGCDRVVVSPGVPGGHPILLEAARRRIETVSELELGWLFAEGTVIAVTGTNGKSTTVSMIGAILEARRSPLIVAGNVGIPLCSVVRETRPEGFLVLEVSSFQLETIRRFHPSVAAILNLTPDHLDRYRTVDEYYRAKERIIENCGSGDSFVYNAVDPRCAALAAGFGGLRIPFSSEGAVRGGIYLEGGVIVRERDGAREAVIERTALGVAGLHNAENAMAAIACIAPFGVGAEHCREALGRFKGLPHRMEEVATVGGVTFVNDSKATNVEAAVMSLRGLDRDAVLIAGGHDKGGDFSKLVPVLSRVRTVVLIGEAASRIEEALGSRVPVERAESMEEAVALAFGIARPGELVILSPACASFDMFDNFEHRGAVFSRCARRIGERVG